jgi:hypothetical protein
MPPYATRGNFCVELRIGSIVTCVHELRLDLDDRSSEYRKVYLHPMTEEADMCY